MAGLEHYVGHFTIARVCLQRGMALLYLIAFLTVIHQCRPLIGADGLLPIPDFLQRVRFRDAPSLFHLGYSDRLLAAAGWCGVALAAAALTGISDRGPIWLSVAVWLLLYVLYLSVVNVGQRFFGFGWESMLLEAGFFTAFLGPRSVAASAVPVLILRWMLFRTELGAGLIKLRGDAVWRDLTALYFHYETQPLPNPLSWYFHRLPKVSHRFGVVFSHVVQVIVPFGLFGPAPVAAAAAALCTFQQLWLIVSGNYSWLNWLTALLGIAGVSDEILTRAAPLHTLALEPIPGAWQWALYTLAVVTVLLSIQPVLNLCSPRQKMNYSYNRYHLVNSYGAFGSVGKQRYEIVLEGTADVLITPATRWHEYGFKAKPGDLYRTPPQVAPYHLRLDWMVWFLPFSVQVLPRGIYVPGHDLWFVRFVRKLLQNDPRLLRLMGAHPFAAAPPAHVRALFYRYRYTDCATRKATGAWWTRELLGIYLPPVSLKDLQDL